MPAVDVHPDDVVCRRRDLLWRDTGRTVLVLRPGGDQVVELRGAATALWRALAESQVVGRVVAELAEVFDVDDAVATAGLLDAVGGLVDLDLVELNRP